MGLRQTLNENPVVTSAIIGVITLAALFFAFKSACGSRTTGGTPGADKAFFTFDEGKTWFVDDKSNLPPYTKDGKQALRARVYKCGGKEVVLLLEQYPASVKTEIEAGSNPMLIAQALEVRRVGDKKWVSMQKNLMEYGKVTNVKCPDGSPAVHVDPPAD